jgi:hypothetical protein
MFVISSVPRFVNWSAIDVSGYFQHICQDIGNIVGHRPGQIAEVQIHFVLRAQA